jgi:hypothetical protein
MSVCLIPCQECAKIITINFDVGTAIDIKRELKAAGWSVKSISENGVKYVCAKCAGDK